jgi:hypothetical protein
LTLLEYACELWDGCTQQEYNKIEQIQHEAARIVTGLPKFSSLESLYFETGWQPLHSRRRRRKFEITMHLRIYATVYYPLSLDGFNKLTSFISDFLKLLTVGVLLISGVKLFQSLIEEGKNELKFKLYSANELF